MTGKSHKPSVTTYRGTALVLFPNIPSVATLTGKVLGGEAPTARSPINTHAAITANRSHSLFIITTLRRRHRPLPPDRRWTTVYHACSVNGASVTFPPLPPTRFRYANPRDITMTNTHHPAPPGAARAPKRRLVPAFHRSRTQGLATAFVHPADHPQPPPHTRKPRPNV